MCTVQCEYENVSLIVYTFIIDSDLSFCYITQPLTKQQSRGIVTYTVKLESLSAAVRAEENSIVTGNRSFVNISNKATYFSRSQEALFKLPNMSGPDTAYRLEIFASTSSGSGRSTFVEIPAKSQS